MVQNRRKVKVNPFNFFGGPFFKVNFLENYTSNEAQTKLKTLSIFFLIPEKISDICS